MALAQQTQQLLEILGNGFPAHRLQLIWEYKDAILQWINSKEFSEKYANHPFPPLLNPATITWEQTDPQVAWDFNLPLPPFYQMLYLCPHGTGHGAMLTFLRSSGGGGISISYNEGPTTAIGHYISHYTHLIQNRGKFNVLAFECYGLEKFGSAQDREKYFALVGERVPALMQVRDPLDSLKNGALNWEALLKNIKDLQKEFNLTFDYHYFNKILHIRNKKYQLPTDFSYLKKQAAIWDSLVRALNPVDLVYMDMQELSKERAFNTLQKLSLHFGFNAPQEKDRKVYEAKHFSGNLFFLWSNAPLVLWINHKDLESRYSKKNPNNILATSESLIIDRQNSYKIFFSFPEGFEGFVDIMDYFKGEIGSQVGAYMQEVEFEALRKDLPLWEATQEYVNEFLEYLSVESKKAQSERITTEQVLEALAENKDAAKNLESVLEPELKHIKANRPDIVKSWKHYQEFVKICKKV